MKVRSAVRRLCRDCYVVKKKRVVYIRCKTVKKHKQRQGFHTEAGVSAWEGGHVHGWGACACDGGVAVASHPWAGPVAALSATDRPYRPSGAAHNLPWIPAWASVPGLGGGKAACSESSESIALRAAGLQASSALRALGWWVSSALSQIRGGGR